MSVDEVTANNVISLSLETILRQCVLFSGLGGVASKLGEAASVENPCPRQPNRFCAPAGLHEELAIQVSAGVNPDRVRCLDSPRAPSLHSCDTILAQVPFRLGSTRFGPADDPSVDVDVPRGWRYRDLGQDCSIVLGTKDRKVVSTSWSNMWFGAASIVGMCVRQGQSGVYKYFGEQVLYLLRFLVAEDCANLCIVEDGNEIFIGVFHEGVRQADIL